MAEQEPTSVAQSEIDAFQAKRAAQDKEKLLNAIFVDEVKGAVPIEVTHRHKEDGEWVPRTAKHALSPAEMQARRDAEGTEYYKHLESLANRSDNYDPYEQDLMNSAHDEALVDNEKFDADKEHQQELEKTVTTDPRFRVLLKMGMRLDAQRNKVLTGGEDADAEMQSAQEQEDEFTALFDVYEAAGLDEEALQYILDRAFTETGPNAPKEKVSQPTAPEDATKASGDEAAEGDAEPGEKAPFDDLSDIEPFNLTEETEPTTSREKIKGWWNAHKDGIREKFSLDYWAARWSTASYMKNSGVIEGESFEEVQKRKEHRRTIFMVGALALVGVAAADAIYHIAEAANSVDPSMLPTPGGHHPSASEFLNPHTAAPAPHATEQHIETPSYADVPRGEGGYALFEKAGLTDQQWNQYKGQLAELFPQDFKPLAALRGDIGLAHSGLLSAPAQTFINGLPR